ncbi:MAG: DUF6978 family protein [Thermodesulfovibrionales bacterium]
MPDINLMQAEADALIAMEKHRLNDTRWDYPGLGGTVIIPLVSMNRRENFLLDVSRSRIDLLKGTYQNRARQTVILVRLDFGGQPHRNPDDTEIPSPHLHIYREGFGDKWAMTVPADSFANIAERWQALEDFMRFCNVTETPIIERGLFG